mmetsp:Transcript_17933/g.69473  ORF Transcript_17933/g.69473 Transcript_17933/m.69473 type:complete len:350 (-) Transcript_17933:199-1248(-)
MQVSVDEVVDEDHLEVSVEAKRGQLLLELRVLLALLCEELGDVRTLLEALHQHSFGAEGQDRLREADVGEVLEALRERLEVLRLHQKVHLVDHAAHERARRLLQVHPCHPGQLLQPVSDGADDAEVLRDGVGDVRVADLDGHLLALVRDGDVHLGNCTAGDWSGVEFAEELLHLHAVGRAHLLLREGKGMRRHRAVQPRQALAHGQGEEVGPRRRPLAKLDHAGAHPAHYPQQRLRPRRSEALGHGQKEEECAAGGDGGGEGHGAGAAQEEPYVMSPPPVERPLCCLHPFLCCGSQDRHRDGSGLLELCASDPAGEQKERRGSCEGRGTRGRPGCQAPAGEGHAPKRRL